MMKTTTQRVMKELRALLTTSILGPDFTEEEHGFTVLGDNYVQVDVGWFPNNRGTESVRATVEWTDWSNGSCKAELYDFTQETDGDWDAVDGWADWISQIGKMIVDANKVAY